MLAVILSIFLVAVAPHALAQVLWRAPVEDSERAIAANDGRVFALQGQRLVVFDRETGRELWQSEAPRGGSQKIQGVVGSTVIWALTVSGAYTTTRYLGLDLHTGKKRWDTLAGTFLGASETTLRFVALAPMPRRPRLVALDLKTGQIEEKQYLPSSRAGCEPFIGANQGVAFYRGRYWLLVQDRCGRHLVGIRFKDMEADASIDVPDSMIVAASAPDGFLFLRPGVWDSTQKGAANLGLLGIELSSGRKIHYHANGISTKTRVWVLSNIYVGRPDGQLAVFDRNSGKRLSSFQAGDGPIYSVTAAGGVLLVHSEGELFAFRRPGG